MWKPIQWSRTTRQYDVFRNGARIGAASPGSHQNDAITYIDHAVSAGESYEYEVEAIASDRPRSARSAAVSIVHSTLGVSVPSISIDPGGFEHARPYLERGKAFLETWYPKIANILAYPKYLPPLELTLRAVKDDRCPGAGWVDGTPGTVHVCAYPNVATSDDLGLFVHEATHLIKSYDGPQLRGAGESIASWAGNLAIGRDNVKPGELFSYFDDYQYGSYFYDWVSRARSRPDFIRDLNLVCHDGSYTDAWIEIYTGQSIGKLFGVMMGTTFTSPGALKNAAYGYAFPESYDAGSAVVLADTPPNDAHFFQGPMKAPGQPGPLRWAKACLVEDAELRIVLGSCDAQTPQWLYQSGDGSFRNAATKRCLQARQASDESRTALVTAPCDQSSAQRWDMLPP